MSPRARIARLLLSAAFALPFVEAGASPSSLDATWGDDGTVALPKGRLVKRLATQPGGSLIAVVTI